MSNKSLQTGRWALEFEKHLWTRSERNQRNRPSLPIDPPNKRVLSIRRNRPHQRVQIGRPGVGVVSLLSCRRIIIVYCICCVLSSLTQLVTLFSFCSLVFKGRRQLWERTLQGVAGCPPFYLGVCVASVRLESKVFVHGRFSRGVLTDGIQDTLA